MSLSIPYVMNSEDSQFRGGPASTGAGNGEDSPSDFWGIMNGISGLAGDVGTTLNSLSGVIGPGGTPRKVATIKPQDPTAPNYLLYGGIALVMLVAIWMFTKGK